MAYGLRYVTGVEIREEPNGLYTLVNQEGKTIRTAQILVSAKEAGRQNHVFLVLEDEPPITDLKRFNEYRTGYGFEELNLGRSENDLATVKFLQVQKNLEDRIKSKRHSSILHGAAAFF